MRSLPDAIFSRLTGSGSCIFSAFESKNTALNSQIIFNKSFLAIAVSGTITLELALHKVPLITIYKLVYCKLCVIRMAFD